MRLSFRKASDTIKEEAERVVVRDERRLHSKVAITTAARAVQQTCHFISATFARFPQAELKEDPRYDGLDEADKAKVGMSVRQNNRS